MASKRLLPHRPPPASRWLYYVVAAGLVLLLSGWLSRQQVITRALDDVHHFHCRTGSEREQSLSLRLVTPVGATQVGRQLCADPVVARHAGTVSISWQPREEMTAEQLLAERHDVIWSREHTLHAMVPEVERYYEKLLGYEDYHVYWLQREVHRQAPALHDQRIGLLADTRSHTHYLLPLLALKESGIAPDSDNLVYYDSIASLYEGFRGGEFDMISGSQDIAQRLGLDVRDQHLIDDDATAAAFFIRVQMDDPALRCAILGALRHYDTVFSRATPVTDPSLSC